MFYSKHISYTRLVNTGNSNANVNEYLSDYHLKSIHANFNIICVPLSQELPIYCLCIDENVSKFGNKITVETYILNASKNATFSV